MAGDICRKVVETFNVSISGIFPTNLFYESDLLRSSADCYHKDNAQSDSNNHIENNVDVNII